MRYRMVCWSERGIRRRVNQDALLVKCGVLGGERMILSVVCDGMGGLQKGEVASAAVVRAFSGWFEREWPVIARGMCVEERLFVSWEEMIQRVHGGIRKYGEKRGIQMGTTLTAMLFFRGRYYVVQVGDSRAYEVAEEVCQLTGDQTLVQREVEEGILTREQALRDQRRNVLLQCVGASLKVEPVYREGAVLEKAVYLLCSDGFWHEAEGELTYFLGLSGEKRMKERLKRMVRQCQTRGEMDDISAIVIGT